MAGKKWWNDNYIISILIDNTALTYNYQNMVLNNNDDKLQFYTNNYMRDTNHI